MADGGATFFFDTNIEAVVSEIENGLRRIQRANNAATKGTPQDSSTALKGQEQDAGAAARNALQRLEEVRKSAQAGLLKDGKTLTEEFRKVLAGLNKDLGAIAQKRGINIDVALKLRQETVSFVENQMKRALETAAKDAKLAPQVGTKNVTSNPGDFAAGFKDGGRQDRALVADIKRISAEVAEQASLEAETTGGKRRARDAQRRIEAASERAAQAETEVVTALDEQAAATRDATGATNRTTSAAKKTAAAQEGVAKATQDLQTATEEATAAVRKTAKTAAAAPQPAAGPPAPTVPPTAPTTPRFADLKNLTANAFNNLEYLKQINDDFDLVTKSKTRAQIPVSQIPNVLRNIQDQKDILDSRADARARSGERTGPISGVQRDGRDLGESKADEAALDKARRAGLEAIERRLRAIQASLAEEQTATEQAAVVSQETTRTLAETRNAASSEQSAQQQVTQSVERRAGVERELLGLAEQLLARKAAEVAATPPARPPVPPLTFQAPPSAPQQPANSEALPPLRVIDNQATPAPPVDPAIAQRKEADRQLTAANKLAENAAKADQELEQARKVEADRRITATNKLAEKAATTAATLEAAQEREDRARRNSERRIAEAQTKEQIARESAEAKLRELGVTNDVKRTAALLKESDRRADAAKKLEELQAAEDIRAAKAVTRLGEQSARANEELRVAREKEAEKRLAAEKRLQEQADLAAQKLKDARDKEEQTRLNAQQRLTEGAATGTQKLQQLLNTETENRLIAERKLADEQRKNAEKLAQIQRVNDEKQREFLADQTRRDYATRAQQERKLSDDALRQQQAEARQTAKARQDLADAETAAYREAARRAGTFVGGATSSTGRNASGKTAAQEQAEQRLRDLYPTRDAAGTPQLRENFSNVGGNYFKELKDGTATYFKVIGKGLHELTNEANELAKAIKVDARNGGGKGGLSGFFQAFAGGLTSGGFGHGGESGLLGLAGAAGTTAKYSALYGALNLLQQGFAQAGQEVLNFEDSQTNLAIALENATGATEESTGASGQFLVNLEAIAGAAGANVGDVMDIAAAGIRSLGTESGKSREDLEKLGTEFARQVQIMSVLAKTDLKDAQGNIRATYGAFAIPITAASRINDAVVTANKVGGGDETQTSQGLATFSEAANAAGFSPELAATLVSAIQKRTDASGLDIGNKLSKITAIAGGSAGQTALAKINAGLDANQQIDLNADTATQLTQLSAANDSLTVSQRKRLISSIAGTTATKEFLVVLESLKDLNAQDLFNPGAGADESNRRLQDLTQTIRDLKGAASNIVINIRESGALDLVLVALKGITNFAQSVSNILGVFNSALPSAVRHTLVPLLEVLAALYAIGKVRAAGGVISLLTQANTAIRPQDAVARRQLADYAALDAARKQAAITAARPAIAAGPRGLGATPSPAAARTGALPAIGGSPAQRAIGSGQVQRVNGAIPLGPTAADPNTAASTAAGRTSAAKATASATGATAARTAAAESATVAQAGAAQANAALALTSGKIASARAIEAGTIRSGRLAIGPGPVTRSAVPLQAIASSRGTDLVRRGALPLGAGDAAAAKAATSATAASAAAAAAAQSASLAGAQAAKQSAQGAFIITDVQAASGQAAISAGQATKSAAAASAANAEAQAAAARGGAASAAQRAGTGGAFFGTRPAQGASAASVGSAERASASSAAGAAFAQRTAARRAAESQLALQLRDARLAGSAGVAERRVVQTLRERALAGANGFAVFGGLKALFTPLTAAIGVGIAAFLTIGAIVGRVNDIRAAKDASRATREDLATIDTSGLSTEEKIQARRDAASSLATQASVGLKAASGIGRVADASGDARRRAESDKRESELQNRLADQDAIKLKDLAANLNSLSAFGDPATITAEKVAKSFEAITISGGSARQEVTAFARVLGLIKYGKDGKDAEGNTRPGFNDDGSVNVDKTSVISKVGQDFLALGNEPLFTKKFEAPKLSRVDQLAADSVESGATYVDTDTGEIKRVGQQKPKLDLTNPATGFLKESLPEFNAILGNELQKTTKDKKGRPSAKAAKGIADKIVAALLPKYRERYEALDPDLQKQALSPEKLQSELERGVFGSLRGTDLTNGKRLGIKLDNSEVIAQIGNLKEGTDRELSALQPGDNAGKIQILKEQAQYTRGLIALAKDPNSPGLAQALIEAKQSEAELAAAEIAQFELQRTSEQSRLTDPVKIKAVGQKFFKLEAIKALQTENFDALRTILNQSSDEDVALLKATLASDLAKDQLALDKEKKTRALFNKGKAAPNSEAGVYGSGGGHYEGGTFIPDAPVERERGKNKAERDAEAKVKADKQRQKDLDKFLGETIQSDDSAFDNGPNGNNSASSRAEKDIARRNLRADGQFTLDALDRSVADAKTRLDALKKSDDGYYAALKDYEDKKRSYADELAIGNKFTIAQLGIDISDPVAVARLEYQKSLDAQAQLQKNIKEGKTKFKSPEDRASAEATLELASRSAKIDLESKVQSQFLSNLQTAEQLGNISHAQYINFLKQRSAQLGAQLAAFTDANTAGAQATLDAKNATDLLIKGAADALTGVFNIGDIKLPTLFEVRKSINEKFQGDVLASNGSFSTAGNVTNDSSTQNVILNGVPIQTVLKFIEEQLGKRASTNFKKKVGR